jgi:hypothetical protein
MPSAPASAAIVVAPGVCRSPPRLGARDLGVGRVAGGQRDVVLAGRARRHVLVGPRAAHHPDVGLHPVPLEAHPVADAIVGLDELLVGGLQPVLVAIEGIGVLHDELARAQDPGARARLVAALGLEVVEQHRQLAIGAHRLRDVEGDGLLVAQGEDQVGPPAVLELEHLLDVVAPAALPELGRRDDRHQHLLAADPVALLAHDLRHVLVHAPAGRQPAPQARADLADEPGAHAELVRQRLGVGGGLALGGQEVAIQAGHPAAKTTAGSPAHSRADGLGGPP